MESMAILLGWILFAGTHIGLSIGSIRSKLVGLLGEKGFLAFYSIIAFITFGFLIKTYGTLRPAGSLFMAVGMRSSILIHFSELLMIVALILLIGGFFNPSPLGMTPASITPSGIIRITRHPMNMAFALYGFSHLLVNRYAGDWIFFGGFILYGILGALHQDFEQSRKRKEELDGFLASTSVFPFAAILKGKQQFSFSEINKTGLAIAIVAAVVIRIAHPSVSNLMELIKNIF